MGCGNRPKQLVTLQGPQSKGTTKKSQRQPPISEDFHCPTCGLTLPRREQGRKHRCIGKRKVPYQQKRLTDCLSCPYNQDDVCTKQKQLYPEKPCKVSVGVTIPFARCPIGKWEKVHVRCNNCNRLNFKEEGVDKCKYCGMETRVISVAQPRVPPPEKKRVVVTTIIGEQASQLAYFNLPVIQKYADKCNADLRIICEDHIPWYPIGNKFQVKHISEQYDRTLFVDIDVYIKEDAPNIFEEFPSGLWMHDDEVVEVVHGWFTNHVNYVATMLNANSNGVKCWNTGVVLFDKEQSHIWNTPTKVVGLEHTTEQTIVGLQSRGIVNELPTEYNCQWYFPTFQELMHKSWFIHLAMAPHYERLKLLKKLPWGK